MNTTSEDSETSDFSIIPFLDTIIMWSLLPLGTLGIFTNILNVAVFTMIGFQDSIFVCFSAMSVFDLCYIIIISTTNTLKIISLIEPGLLYYFDMKIYMVSLYGDMIFDISAWVKTFIAVQRGCCVAFPFHVSRVFTRKRAAVVIVCLCLISLTCYVSDEFMKVTRSYTDVLTNKTYYFSIYSERTIVTDTIRRNVKTFLICTCDILILLSLIVIVYGMASTPKSLLLLSAGKVKIVPKSKLLVKIPSSFNQNEKGVSNNANNCKREASLHTKQKISKNSREIRVVKQVALISALHLICYTPVAACAIMYEIMTNIYSSFQLTYSFLIISSLLRLTGPLNATINFFIYRTYNYKFQRSLLIMCKKKFKDGRSNINDTTLASELNETS